MEKDKTTITHTTDTNTPYNIEISVPNDLAKQQVSILKKLVASYGGIIVTADKITFPNLPQWFSSTGMDLSYIAVRLVNEAKGRIQAVPFLDKATVKELRRRYSKNCRIVLDFYSPVYEFSGNFPHR